MQGFVICSPDLPGQMQQTLMEDGWEICMVPYCPSVHPALAGHPEMQICVLNSDEIVVHPDMHQVCLSVLYKKFRRVVIGQHPLRADYPGDIPYNGKVVGNLFIHNTNYTDPVLLKRTALQGLSQVHVNQGYTGCSTLVVNAYAIITADHGIALAAEMNECDVLTISSGFIKLTGMNYGFIGGAAGWDGENKVYFCGTLSQHPDQGSIESFLDKYGLTPVELSPEPLSDYGALFFVRA